MNIPETIKSLGAIRAEVKQAIADGEQKFTALEKTESGKIIEREISTGQLPTAAGFLQTAITCLEGHLQKAAEITEANKKVEAGK
jgi:hypothetical protein